jgi:hypothetical protein
MHEHWLFLGNVSAHLVALMSGIASVLITFWERIKSRPVARRAFLVIAGLCLLLAFDQAWRDEHKNAQILTDQKAEAWGKYNSCDKERAVLDAVWKASTANAANQHTVLLRQQDTFNQCVLSLTKQNIQEKTKFEVITWNTEQFVTLRDAGMKRAWIVVIIPNKAVPNPIGTLTCDTEFVVADSGVASRDAGGVRTSATQPTRNRAHAIAYQPMTPIAPFMFFTYVEPVSNLAGCRFALD